MIIKTFKIINPEIFKKMAPLVSNRYMTINNIKKENKIKWTAILETNNFKIQTIGEWNFKIISKD